MELVDHKRLETVRNRVNVVHPSRPTQHVASRNGEAGVDNQTQDQDGGGHQSLRQRARGGSNGSEDHGHGQGGHYGEEKERKEGTGSPAKTGHEVERDVESDGVEELVWHVTQHARYCFSKRVVHGVASLLFDNWTLRIEGQNLVIRQHMYR